MRRLTAAIAVAVSLGAASTATAAFPGRDGLLAVQPLHGNGIVLVAADGRGQHRICMKVSVCGHPVRPRFSPDGRSIVFAGPAIRLIATDGSCQNCRFGVARNPAVMPTGNLVTFALGGALAADGVDGLRLASLIQSVTDAVWSASGKVAVVRRGGVWVGTPGNLRWVGQGSSPSWSPNGTRLAFVRRGWVGVESTSGGATRRLVRGSSPAFSPDGRSIAFVDPSRRLRVIGSFGGRARTVGRVRGLAVDWQPLPAHPGACVAPPGAKVLAQSSQAVVTSETGPNPADGVMLPQTAAMGCLLADGRERLLEQSTFNSIDGATEFPTAAVGGTWAAVMRHDYDDHYNTVDEQHIEVFDLRTGAASGFGGEASGCGDYGSGCSRIDQILVGPEGVSAVHVRPGSPDPGDLLHATCASPSFCATYDQYGHVSVSTDPTVASSWSATEVAPLAAISCPSTSLCVGIDQSSRAVYTSTNPASSSPTWTKLQVPTDMVLTGVACPSTSLCVAAGREASSFVGPGMLLVSTNPAGGADAWSAESITGAGDLLGISCPTTSACFATDDRADLVSSTNPTGGPSAWAVRKVSPFSLQQVSCASSSLCAASVFGPPSSSFVFSSDPGNGPWKVVSNPSSSVYSVSCPSVSLCVTLGASRTGVASIVGVSTDPGSGSWSTYEIPGTNPENVSCPTASFCVLGGSNNGNVLISTNPAGGAGTWTPVLADRIDCASTPAACGTEQIVASDRTGVHTVASSVEYEPQTGPQLTRMTLTGDTLSWNDHGSPKTAQLQR